MCLPRISYTPILDSALPFPFAEGSDGGLVYYVRPRYIKPAEGKGDVVMGQFRILSSLTVMPQSRLLESEIFSDNCANECSMPIIQGLGIFSAVLYQTSC